MKKILLVSWLLGVGHSALADSCLERDNLIKLDQQYETAMRNGDAAFLNNLLADDFYWVHNLASAKENKAQLIERVQREEKPKARRSHDLSVRRLENTAVIEGLTSVEKWNSDGKTFRTSRYQIMRTYVAIKNAAKKSECKLLAVQSMKVWSSEGQ